MKSTKYISCQNPTVAILLLALLSTISFLIVARDKSSTVVGHNDLIHKKIFLSNFTKDNTMFNRINQSTNLHTFSSSLRSQPLFQQINSLYTNTSLTLLRSEMEKTKSEVRTMRSSKVIMSYNSTAIQLTNKLQDLTRCYLLSSFALSGPKEPYYAIEITLKFPPVLINNDARLRFSSNGTGIQTLYVELVPMLILPHSYHTVIYITTYINYYTLLHIITPSLPYIVL
jgi:hypothetical protein